MIQRPLGPRTSPMPIGPVNFGPVGVQGGRQPRTPMRSPGSPFAGRYLASMKKGGKVKKTGLYKLHRGEKVVPLSSLRMAR